MGSAEEDLEGRERRDLCVVGSPGRRAAARHLGHRQQCSLAPLAPLTAAKEASSMPRRQPLRGAQRAAAPGEVMFLAERKERQKRNQSGVEERERQRRREGTGEPD